ncbi:hypothetical protein AJ87_35080 [Rhizobium yanglingense]|nr:hypothetical protein AJ87_35080 [Rhizobium yanglingense]
MDGAAIPAPQVSTLLGRCAFGAKFARKAAFFHGCLPAHAADMGKIIVLGAGNMSDPAMTVGMKAKACRLKPGKAVAVEIGMRQHRLGPAVGDERNAPRLQEFHALVPAFRANEQHGVDPLPVDETAAHVEFALAARHRGNHEIEAGGRKMFGAAGEHIEKVRRADMARIARECHGDKFGTLFAKASCRSIGAITVSAAASRTRSRVAGETSG